MELRAALTYRAPALTYGAPAISNMDGNGANQGIENANLLAFYPNSFAVVQNVINALTYHAPALTYGAPATLELPPAIIRQSLLSNIQHRCCPDVCNSRTNKQLPAKQTK